MTIMTPDKLVSLARAILANKHTDLSDDPLAKQLYQVRYESYGEHRNHGFERATLIALTEMLAVGLDVDRGEAARAAAEDYNGRWQKMLAEMRRELKADEAHAVSGSPSPSV